MKRILNCVKSYVINYTKSLFNYTKNLFKNLFAEPLTKREYALIVLIALLIIRLMTL